MNPPQKLVSVSVTAAMVSLTRGFIKTTWQIYGDEKLGFLLCVFMRGTVVNSADVKKCYTMKRRVKITGCGGSVVKLNGVDSDALLVT